MSAAPSPPTNGAAAVSAAESRDPSGFLSEIIGAPVTVKLNSGVVYKGTYVFIHYSFIDIAFVLRERERETTERTLMK